MADSRRPGAQFTGAVMHRPVGIVPRAVRVVEESHMELASVVHSAVVRSRRAAATAARSLEVAGQLRTAIMEGDDARIARLLSDLLRVRGLTKGQRVRLQSRALLNLVHSLRSAALNDELTGLLNRRGFTQTATRLLDLALRDHQAAHLVYFRLAVGASEMAGGDGVCTRDVLLRRMGNFLRDSFPSYGVYEVLGRLSGGEFAALTPLAEHAARGAIMLRARTPESGRDTPALPLQVAVARFDPAAPAAIDELLHHAADQLPQAVAPALETAAPVMEVASVGSAPRSGLTLA
jgi:GGDEF domain-containing protein